MIFEQSVLYNEVRTIVTSDAPAAHAIWSVIIYTPVEEITPLKLISIDINRNYSENFGDEIMIQFTIGSGTLLNKIVPYKSELLVSILEESTSSTGSSLSGGGVGFKLMTGILIYDVDERLAPASEAYSNVTSGDIVDVINVSMQLLDPTLEKMRLTEVGGIYRDNIPGDLAKYFLLKGSKLANTDHEDNHVIGVDMVEYDNTYPVPNTIIPNGTRIIDVADYIQNHGGGIYNAGIGTFLQDGMWYIWPLYNARRFDVEPTNLTVINVPDNKYKGMDKTFRFISGYSGGIIILSTGETSTISTSNFDQLNLGSSTDFVHGDRILDGFGIKNNNRYSIIGDSNLSKRIGVISSKYDTRLLSKNKISYNPFAEASRVVMRSGSTITLLWEHSRPSLIYPGMPVRLYYLQGDGVEEVMGTVLAAHHFIFNTVPGPTSGKFSCNTALVIFLENR